MSTPRSEFAMGVLHDGRVIVVLLFTLASVCTSVVLSFGLASAQRTCAVQCLSSLVVMQAGGCDGNMNLALSSAECKSRAHLRHFCASQSSNWSSMECRVDRLISL